MRSLLRLVSLRHFRRHLPRVLLTIAGITLGVAGVVAIGLVNASVSLGMRRIAEEMAGDAQLVVSGDRTGVPEDLVERVKTVAGVIKATPVIKQTVELKQAGGRPAAGRLQIYAVDSLDDPGSSSSAFRREDLELPDPLRFVAQPRSIIVTEALARRYGLERQLNRAVLVVAGGQGTFELTVRGLLHGSAGDVFGGNLALMDTYSAQKVFGRGAKVDEIQVFLRDRAPLAEIAAAREAIGAAVGPGYDVARPLDRGRQSERIVHAWQAAVGLLSIVTLFVGAFLIYNTVAVSVAERRREIGILRAIGVTRGQIAGLVVTETLVLAAAGTAAGLAAGSLGARALLAATTRMMSQLLLETAVDEVRYTPGTLAAGALAGLVVAVVAALLPALAAARVPPLEALRGVPSEAARSRRTGVMAAAGAVVLAFVAVGCLSPVTRHHEPAAVATLLGLLLGFVLLCPVLVGAVLRALVPAIALGFGAVGRVTAAALRRAPTRSTVTACAIAIGCALVVSSSTVAQSFRVSIGGYVARTTVADILVSCSAEIFSPSSLPMAPGVEAALAAHPAVAELQRVRVVDLDLGGRRADLFVLDTAAWERRVGFPFLRATPSAVTDLVAGRAVAVSENFANTFGVDVGDEVPIRTPRGPVSMRVAGIFLDYSTAFGAVVLDRSVYRRYWDDDQTDLFHVYLRPEADPRAVRAELAAAVAERFNVFVLTTAEVREKIGGMLDDCFLLIRLQDLVAAAVAVLGLLNTLIIAVLERRREIAVLRSMGASRVQIGGAIVLESTALALVGFVLGAALGLALGWINVAVVSTLHTGWRFAVHANFVLAAELLAVVMVAAVVAAWIPARLAAGGEIVRGLVVE